VYRFRVLCVLLVVALVALAASAAPAAKVTVYRDVWGVPHVYGDSETAAAYGYGYAQAADRLEQICRNIRQAEGTLAEVDGKAALGGDFMARVIGHADYSREQYNQMPANVRAYIEAYQAGVKRYMTEHPDQVPSWAPELQPWQVTAIMRTVIFMWPLGDAMSKLAEAGIPATRPNLSSNSWSIAAGRTADNCAILLIDPHVGWEGVLRWHEASIHAPGLDVAGAVVAGTPFVALGYNNHVAWTCATGGPDTSDIYAEKVDPSNPMRYKVDNEWREFQVKNVVIKVKEGDSSKTATHKLLFSRHGPIVAQKDGIAYALATPYIDQTRQPEMMYRLNRATSTAEVTGINADLQWMPQNVMYAGTNGEIHYVRIGRVPIRPDGVDIKKPIPGDTTANDWRGLHPLKDLVQLHNPPAGYMQNCNTTPTLMCEKQPVDPLKYKWYIFNNDPGRPWRVRGMRADQVLDANDHVTQADALALANDTHVLCWEYLQQVLRYAARNDFPEVTAQIGKEIVDTLVDWDGNMEADSVGAALFWAWWWRELPKACPNINAELLLRPNITTERDERRQMLEALKPAIDWLVKTHGTWRVTWGDINRVGRDGKTFPVAGAGNPTTLRCLGGGEIDEKTGTMVGNVGQSCTTVVFLKPGGVEAYSVNPWGESDDPKSPHYLDQAEKLLSKKQLKPTWFQREDLMRGNNVESTMTLDHAEGE